MSTFSLLLILALGVDHSGSLVTSERQKGGGHESTVVSRPSSDGSGVLGPDKETTAPEPVSRRYTRVELAKQAVDYANRQRQLQATVNPPNQVWNHLKNDHGFTAEQVDGLTFNQALWVHSGAHVGVITPWTGKPEMAAKIEPRYELRKFCGPGGCYWQRVRVN